MFKSAILRLSSWYLFVLMSVTILFSFAMYGITSTELANRLSGFRDNIRSDSSFEILLPPNIARIAATQNATAKANLITQLLYANLFILIFGGIGSYLLAKHHIKPIEDAHAAQSRFTSDVSHELRTPLASIKTEIEVALSDKKTTNSELREVLESNLEEVNKLSNLSETLLNISRLEDKQLEIAPTDVSDLIAESTKSFGRASERIKYSANKNQQLIASINDTSIMELFKILLENAIKYSPDNTDIKIETAKDHNSISVSISNEGKGIPSDKLPYIFDRFYQVDSSRTHDTTHGLGLGLSLAKTIVELHEGELSVKSHPGKTTFTVKLPK